jgi:hypothetical protein
MPWWFQKVVGRLVGVLLFTSMLASVLGLAILLIFPSLVVVAEAKGPNTGKISLSGGIDYTTDYYFRGIVQETKDLVLQPYGGLTFKLYEGKTGLTGLNLTVGTWNSLHWGPTGLDGAVASDPKVWYESDFYATLAAQLFQDLTFGVTYTAYMSPNGFFRTVEEVAFGLSLNDSKWLGPFALNPSVLLAVETNGQADAGADKGVYLQLGVAPGFALLSDTKTPISVSVPLTLGLSLSDYYERIGVGGSDDTFGYFSGGITAGVPLAFIPADFGSWQLKGGAQFLALGDNLKTVNRNDNFEVISTVGIALNY